jgi:hypothetical protein
MSMLVLRAEGDLRRGGFPWRARGFMGAAMDLTNKGIKARRGHRYLHAARHVGANGRVSVTVPVRRGWILSLALPIPSATITLHGTAIVHQTGFPETDALLKGLGSLIPAGRRATGWVTEIVSEGEFLTDALGVPLGQMSNPAASLARVPAAQEGGSR